MQTSEGETWIVTHMNHIHIAPILIIFLVIVHPWDNSTIFHMSKWTPISLVQDLNQIPIFVTQTGGTILIFRGKLKSLEIVLPNTRNCTILNICSSIANLPIIHPAINRYHSSLWKTPSKPSCSSQAMLLVTWRMLLW
jgi:hypothetical protein